MDIILLVLRVLTHLSELKLIPINSTMIKQYSTLDYKDYVLLKLEEDITNKTVLLSIGGYLILPDSKIFYRHSKDNLVIDFKNYAIENRFFESKEYIDYSGFNLDTPSTNSDQYIIGELRSNDFIANLLMMSQSFVILLYNTDIFYEIEAVRPSLMPGVYTSYIKPEYPLILGEGKIGDYWYTEQRPWWSLNVVDGLENNRIYHTNDLDTLLSIDGSNVPYDPVNWSRASYMKMGSSILEVVSS